MASIWGFEFRQRLLALGRDRIKLAALVVLTDARQPHFLEHGERRVDDAGARRIIAADPLAELLDDLVAVAGLLGDQGENDELQFAAVEHPALARAEPAAAPAPAERPLPEAAMAAMPDVVLEVTMEHGFPPGFRTYLRYVLSKDISLD